MVVNDSFSIISRCRIKDASKLLFALTNDFTKSTIAIFYLFDLFKGQLMILVGYNIFQNGSGASLAKAKVMVDLVSIYRAIVRTNL